MALRFLPPALAQDGESLERFQREGFKEADWARRDPDLALLHGDPEFERLYPDSAPHP